MMGSGGMIVMDEKTCMVDLAKYFLNFLRDESCGKCISCREGTQRMWEIVRNISEGKGKPSDWTVLEELAVACKDASMCGLGQTAANPVLSTLRYFRHEFESSYYGKTLSGRRLRQPDPLYRPARQVHRVSGLQAGLPQRLHQGNSARDPPDRPEQVHQMRRLSRSLPV